MRHLLTQRPLLAAGLLTAALAGSATGLAYDRGISAAHAEALSDFVIPQEMTYYVSLVDYIEADAIYGKALTELGQVIVTDAPQANAKKSLTVTVPLGKRLYLVEVIEPAPAEIPYQIASFAGRIRLALHDAPKAYVSERTRKYHNPMRMKDGYSPVSRSPFAVGHRGLTPEQQAVEDSFLPSETAVSYSQDELISQSDFEETLRWMLGLAPHRASGQIAKKAFDGVVERLKSYGFEVEHFNNDGVRAFKKGSSDKWYALGAHFDSYGRILGADDDAGGSAIVMEVAKRLGKEELKNGLAIYLFDREEVGLKGSAALARRVQSNKPAGMIQIEMPLYNAKPGADVNIIECRGKPGKELYSLLAKHSKSNSLVPKKACTDRSDHSSFWGIGAPATVISEAFFNRDGNPQYHKRGDTLSAKGLDFKYFANIGNAVYKSVEELVK